MIFRVWLRSEHRPGVLPKPQRFSYWKHFVAQPVWNTWNAQKNHDAQQEHDHRVAAPGFNRGSSGKNASHRTIRYYHYNKYNLWIHAFAAC